MGILRESPQDLEYRFLERIERIFGSTDTDRRCRRCASDDIDEGQRALVLVIEYFLSITFAQYSARLPGIECLATGRFLDYRANIGDRR
jgi:hypothetical protein